MSVVKGAVESAKKRKSKKAGDANSKEIPQNLDEVMQEVNKKNMKDAPEPRTAFMEMLDDPEAIKLLVEGKPAAPTPPPPKPEPEKRGPGRPPKKKKEDEQKPPTGSIPISNPDLLVKCKRKIKAYYARFPRLAEMLPPPDLATLTEDAAMELCTALGKELCLTDPKPVIRKGLLWLTDLLEDVAPAVGAMAGVDPHQCNLSVPHSFTDVLDRGLTEDPDLADAFDEICIQWLGEISSSPWTRLLLGFSVVVKQVARANASVQVKEASQPDRRELLRKAKENSERLEEIPFGAD